MTNQQPAPVAVDDLPYLEDYLRDVLRPRVERSIQNIEASLTESIWRHIVREIAGEHPGATEATQAMIRSLIADRLGLKIRTSMDLAYEPAPGAPPPQHRVPEPSGPMPEVVIRGRGGPMPLVNAILANPRIPMR